MFGNNFGLGMFKRDQFDSVAGNAAAHLAERLTPIDERQLLANIQTTRAIALSVVLQLADAIAENALGDEVLPSEYLDTLMLAGVYVILALSLTGFFHGTSRLTAKHTGNQVTYAQQCAVGRIVTF